MLKEFKEFAVKGNVVDMAVGIIIGAAFTSVVRSLVDDIIMPPIGWLTGGVDFSDLFIPLTGGDYASVEAAAEAGAATINIGLFINAVISFLLVALAVFYLVKGINQLKTEAEKLNKKKAEEEAAAPAEPPEDVVLLKEIRDLLAKQSG